MSSSLTTYLNFIKSIIHEKHKHDDFLIKSFMCLNYIKTIKDYRQIDDGRLQRPSANCLFTIVSIDGIKYFVKVVDYDTLLNGRQDLLLFDIISGYIFLTLPKEYYKFISHYKYSFLSYYNDNKFDYIDNYNCYINSLQKLTTKTKCYVCITEIINGKVLDEIFNNFFRDDDEDTYQKCISIFDNYCNFIDFLIYIGFDYGFSHNDLHFSNMMFDGENIIIIDYGRAVFFKFCDIHDDKINDFLEDEVKKLNFDNDLQLLVSNRTEKKITTTTNNYKDLFNVEYKLFSLFDTYIPSDLSDLKYGFLVYPFILFDLVTFYFNIYIKLLIFLYYTNEVELNTFISFFSKLILIYNNEDKTFNIEELKKNTFNYNILHGKDFTIKEIFNTYKTIVDDYINKISKENKKKQYKYLLDGLLLIVLLIKYRDEKRNKREFIHKAPINFISICFQVILPITLKIEFLNWLNNVLKTNFTLLNECNHHFFVSMIPQPITGGKLIKKRKFLKKYTTIINKGGRSSQSQLSMIPSQLQLSQRQSPQQQSAQRQLSPQQQSSQQQLSPQQQSAQRQLSMPLQSQKQQSAQRQLSQQQLSPQQQSAQRQLSMPLQSQKQQSAQQQSAQRKQLIYKEGLLSIIGYQTSSQNQQLTITNELNDIIENYKTMYKNKEKQDITKEIIDKFNKNFY